MQSPTSECTQHMHAVEEECIPPQDHCVVEVLEVVTEVRVLEVVVRDVPVTLSQNTSAAHQGIPIHPILCIATPCMSHRSLSPLPQEKGPLL